MRIEDRARRAALLLRGHIPGARFSRAYAPAAAWPVDIPPSIAATTCGRKSILDRLPVPVSRAARRKQNHPSA